MLRQELCRTESYSEALQTIQNFYESVNIEYEFGIYKAKKYYHTYMLAKGSINSAVIDTAEVFLPALHASEFAIVHNHPSGSAQPSEKDVALTKSIMTVAKAMDVEFIDHLIMPKNTQCIVSIREYIENPTEIHADNRHSYDNSSDMKFLAHKIMENSPAKINVALLDNQLHLLNVVSYHDFEHNSIKRLIAAIITNHAAMVVPMLSDPELVSEWNEVESVITAAQITIPDVMVLHPTNKEEIISLAESR